MHNQALRKGDAQFHTPHPSGKYTEENPRAFVLQPLSVWTALVNEVIHGNTWTLLRKPLLLWGLSLLQCDLHSALNCGIRLFTRLVIHKKDPKTPKINHRTSVIDCLRPGSSYWDPILSNFFQVLSDWLKPLWLLSLHLYFGPLLQVCQTGKRTKQSLFNRPDYFYLSVNSGLIAQDKNSKRDGKMICISLFISKKSPNRGEIARYTVHGSLYSINPAVKMERRNIWVELLVWLFRTFSWLNNECSMQSFPVTFCLYEFST